MRIADYYRHLIIAHSFRISDFEQVKDDLEAKPNRLYLAMFMLLENDNRAYIYEVKIVKESKCYYYLPFGKKHKDLRKNYLAKTPEEAYHKAGKRASNYVESLKRKLEDYRSIVRSYQGFNLFDPTKELREYASFLDQEN